SLARFLATSIENRGLNPGEGAFSDSLSLIRTCSRRINHRGNRNLMKTNTSHTTKSMNRSPLRRGLLLITLALLCFALAPPAHADCREGCDTLDRKSVV